MQLRSRGGKYVRPEKQKTDRAVESSVTNGGDGSIVQVPATVQGRKRNREERDADSDGVDSSDNSTILSRMDPEYWYNDGALIILVADDGTGFKVHRALLVEHSEHFAEMLDDENIVPDQQSGGVDLIPMKGDPMFDVKSLVRALYNPPYVHLFILA